MIDIGLNLTSSQFAGEQADLVERARRRGGSPDPDRHRSGRQPRKRRIGRPWPVTASPPPGCIPMMPKASMRRPCPPCANWRPCPRWWHRRVRSRLQPGLLPARCRMRCLTPSWRSPPSSGCRCFSTAAMPTTNSSRSCAPGCPACRGRAALLHRLRRRAGQCLALGLHIGVTGWLCDERRGQLLREQVARIPAGRLMIETTPLSGAAGSETQAQTQRTRFLPHIAQVVAACREAPRPCWPIPGPPPPHSSNFRFWVIHGHNSSGAFPGRRLRRVRKHDFSRRLVRERTY